MPDWKAELTKRLSALRLPPERESEIIEELAQHLEERYDALLLGGVPPVEAERQTRDELSAHEMLARELRKIERQETSLAITSSSSKLYFVGDLWKDLRHSMRLLRKSPGFTLITVMTLALGIGANTAIFTFINALILRALPVKEPHELVLFKINGPSVPAPATYNFSYPLYDMFREHSRSFAGIIAANSVGRARFIVNDQTNSEAESVQQQRVSGNFFSVLGVSAIKGRILTEGDDNPSTAQPGAVISYDYWQRRFGGDPNIIGRSVTVNNTALTIVGVTPPGFFGFDVGARPELWWALRAIPDPNLQRTGSWWLRVIGRLRAGISSTQAQAELDAIFRRQIDDEAANTNWTSSEQRRNHFERHAVLEAGATGYTGLRRQFRQPLFVLMVAVGFVLLMACVNVANLMLARAVTRRKEIAIRMAVGASRFRLLRQLLAESILLSVIGGAAGLIVARICVRVLTTYLPEQSQPALDVAPDTQVLLFTLSVSILTGLLFGLTPAWQTTRQDLTSALKDQTAGPSSLALNKVLIVAQVSVSLFLLIGGGLFVRTWRNLRTLDAGMNYENIIQFSLDTGNAYNPKQRSDFYKLVLDRLESLPGAHSATLSYFSLLGGDSISYNISAPGFSESPDVSTECDAMAVGPRFFETMKMPILSGRDFGPQDERPLPASPVDSKPGTVADQPLSAVINQSMARFFYGDQEAVGKRFSIKGTKQVFEVVGVTQDSKYQDLREQTPRIYYVYYFQQPQRTSVIFQLRTDTQASDYGGSIQRLVSELDRKVQVVGIKTMADVVDQSLLRERFMAQTATAFSLVALILACIGLYGVMANAVTRRTNEIGIRMALGAERSRVLRMILSEALGLLAAGLVLGAIVFAAAARFVEGLLYEVSAFDPIRLARSPPFLPSPRLSPA